MPTDPEIAGPLRRLGGWLVDGLVLSALNFVVQGQSRAGLASLAVWGAYTVGSVGRWGKTIGKLAVGIRVVDAADWWTSASWGAAAMRWIVPAAASVLCYLVGLPTLLLLVPVYLPIVTDHLVRGLHDRAAGTVVIVD